MTDVPSVSPSAKRNRRFKSPIEVRTKHKIYSSHAYLGCSDGQLPDACDNEVNRGLIRWTLDQLNDDQLKELSEGKVPGV